MNRPSFDWFDDAIDAAIAIGQQSGVKQRVTITQDRRNPYWITPAFVRLVRTAS